MYMIKSINDIFCYVFKSTTEEELLTRLRDLREADPDFLYYRKINETIGMFLMY